MEEEIKNNHSDKRHNDRKVIIGALLDGTAGKHTEDKIRDWLSEDSDRKSKDKALYEAGIGFYIGGATTDLLTLNSLNRLKKSLGLPVTIYEVEHGIVLIPQYGNTVRRTVRKAPLRRRIALRVAAVMIPVAIAVGIAGVYLNRKAADSQIASYEVAVPAGSQAKEVVLPDGSTVKLKGNSTLAYGSDFMNDRRVTLDGEAYFSVTHDSDNRFTVENGNVRVVVLGTEFNVRALDGDRTAEVVLIKGKVSVEAGEHTATMLPRQKAVIDHYGSGIILLDMNGGEMLRVCEKPLSFDDVRIDDALRLTAEYFGKTLRISPDVDANLYISINASSEAAPVLDDVLESIAVISGAIGYTIEDDLILITKK